MRVVNRLVAVLLAAALLVGGVLVAVEIAVAALDRSPWLIPHDRWYRELRVERWDSDVVRLVGIALCVAGGLLLLLQLARRRPATLPLQVADDEGAASRVSGSAASSSGDRRVSYEVGRSSLEGALGRTAGAVDGVAGARVRVDRGRVSVAVTSHRRQAGDLRARVQHALHEHVNRVGLADPPDVVVRLRTRDQG